MNTFIKFLLAGAALGMGIGLYVFSLPRLREVNRANCAVYGYESDCVTKLIKSNR